MKKLKEKVIYCLEKYPETRNSDTKLTSAVWLEFYKQFLFTAPDGTCAAIKLLDLYKIPHQDSVKRIRATIQNKENKFLPSDPEVRKKRKINEEEWRKFLGYNPEMRTV